MDKKAQDEIEEMLSESIILKYEFDLFKNEISMDLKQYTDDSNFNIRKVKFKKISAFNYVYDNGDLSELPRIEWNSNYDRLEFTSITFLDKSEIEFKGDGADWLSQYIPKYNIAIEIELKILLISAKELVINDNIFHLE